MQYTFGEYFVPVLDNAYPPDKSVLQFGGHVGKQEHPGDEVEKRYTRQPNGEFVTTKTN